MELNGLMFGVLQEPQCRRALPAALRMLSRRPSRCNEAGSLVY